MLTLSLSRNPTLIHLPFFRITFPLSLVFHLNERFLFFNFQKALWDDFAFYFDSYSPFTKEYSSLSLSSAGAFFTSLTLNRAKDSIPFCHIKGQSQAWWSAEEGKAVSERQKAFADTHKSDEDRQVTSLFPDMSHLTSPNPRLRYGRRLAHLSFQNLFLNLCILSFVLSLALLSHFPPLLTSPTVPLPSSRLRSSPIT